MECMLYVYQLIISICTYFYYSFCYLGEFVIKNNIVLIIISSILINYNMKFYFLISIK